MGGVLAGVLVHVGLCLCSHVYIAHCAAFVCSARLAPQLVVAGTSRDVYAGHKQVAAQPVNTCIGYDLIF